MAEVVGLQGRADSSLLDAQADKLVRQAQTGKAGDSAKIEKSARDFESILLGSWLQQAEKSFASVPGGDADDDEDPGKDQFQSMAMQSLGSSLAASGGIGISKMIAASLHRSEEAVEAPSAAAKGAVVSAR